MSNSVKTMVQKCQKIGRVCKGQISTKGNRLILSAEGSESEGANVQYKKVQRKRRWQPRGDNNNNNKSHPPHKRQMNIKTPSPNPKPRMTSTPKAMEDPPPKYIKKC